MQWFVDNWQACLSIVSMALGVGVAISHMLHKDSVAQKIQGIEDMINKIATPKS